MNPGFFEVEITRMSNAPGYTGRLMPDPGDSNVSKKRNREFRFLREIN